jgi:hypothetical protein
MLQKQFARSKVAIQEESEGWRNDPISRRVGRRNFGGCEGQLAFRAHIFTIREALVELLRFTKTSAFGSPGCKATRPAERRESNIA